MLSETGFIKDMCFYPCHRFRVGEWQFLSRLFFINSKHSNAIQITLGRWGWKTILEKVDTLEKCAPNANFTGGNVFGI